MNSLVNMSWFRGLKLLLLSLALISGTAASSDIARSVVEGGRFENGGYFELGAGVYSVNQFDIRQANDSSVQLALLVNGVYQYNGLFVEMVHQSQDGINLGLNFWNSEKWSFDFLAANLQGSWSRSELPEAGTLNEAERNARFLSEDSFYIGAGFRATRYWDDHYVFQYRIVTDYVDNLGIQSSARFGKSWQVRNWNFHALASVDYASKKLNQHIYGVTSEEATELFPEYSPSSSLRYGMELGLAYPLSEKLVLRATYRMNVLPESVTDSAFVVSSYVSYLNVSVSYVF